MNRPAPQAKGAFALVSCLIVIALLTIMVTAYLVSVSMARSTAGAYANRAKAQIAADTGVDTAITSLRKWIGDHPSAVTTWEPFAYKQGDESVPATALYIHAPPSPEDAEAPDSSDSAGTTPTADKRGYMLPLVSGARVRQASNRTECLPDLDPQETDPKKQRYIDINIPGFAGDTQGWIGTSPSNTSRQKMKVPWQDVTDAEGNLVSRFAYWIEDESFRANANLAGSTPRGRLTQGELPSEVPLQALLPAELQADNFAKTAVTLRDGFTNKRFLDPFAFNQVDETYAMGDQAKFLFTLHSSAHDVTRLGGRRLNLNQVVKDTSDPGEIRKQLDRIIGAIRHHSPNFGQRFYRKQVSSLNNMQVTGDHPEIYLNKIAANIRDYIDTDHQPTIVMSDKSVRGAAEPQRALNATARSGASEVWAFGKEAGPHITEYTLRLKADRVPTSSSPNYDIQLEYYVELWNMTSREIKASDLGSRVFIKICNQPGWDAGSGDNIPEGASRDLYMIIPPDTVFPANSATVVTTDATPHTASPSPLVKNASRLVVVPPANIITADGKNRRYTGRANRNVSGFPTLLIRTRNSAYAGGSFNLGGVDTKTEVILATSNGYLDSHHAAGVIEDNNILVDAYRGSRIQGNPKTSQALFFFRGSTMLGNKPDPSNGVNGSALNSGDPRTNNETLFNNADAAVAGSSITRFVTTNSRSDTNRDMNVPRYGGLSRSTADQFNPVAWRDSTKVTDDNKAVDAPAVVANEPLKSIGQLGDIYDPNREPSGTNINFSRGGGRTLAIGQPERTNIWDRDPSSASRGWVAWQLADLFSAQNVGDDPATLDRDESFELPGRINLNGINRDGGMALRALLHGFEFDDHSDALVAGQRLDAGSGAQSALEKLIKASSDRLNPEKSDYKGPFLERGELSEIALLTNPAVGAFVPGVRITEVKDRAREEIVRRIINLTTTRGSVFSVYCVGQAVQKPAKPQPGREDEVLVQSTFARKVTFELVPIYEPALPANLNAFDGSNPIAVKDRFAKPARYEVRILSSLDRI